MKKRTIVLIVILGIIAVLVISIAAMSGTEEFKEGRRSVMDEAEAVVEKRYQGIYIGNDDFTNQTITVGETSISGALTIRDVRTQTGGNYTSEKRMYTWSYVYARVPPSDMDTKIGLVRARYPNASSRIIAFGEKAEVMAKMLQDDGVAHVETTGYDKTYNWCGYNE